MFGNPEQLTMSLGGIHQSHNQEKPHVASVRPKMRLGLEFVETREKILLED
jgi:hypothetical protein